MVEMTAQPLFARPKNHQLPGLEHMWSVWDCMSDETVDPSRPMLITIRNTEPGELEKMFELADALIQAAFSTGKYHAKVESLTDTELKIHLIPVEGESDLLKHCVRSLWSGLR